MHLHSFCSICSLGCWLSHYHTCWWHDLLAVNKLSRWPVGSIHTPLNCVFQSPCSSSQFDGTLCPLPAMPSPLPPCDTKDQFKSHHYAMRQLRGDKSNHLSRRHYSKRHLRQGDSRMHLTCSVFDSLASVRSSSTICITICIHSLILLLFMHHIPTSYIAIVLFKSLAISELSYRSSFSSFRTRTTLWT